jgi:hypothetical protein
MWIACMLRELGEGLKVDFLYIVIEDKKKLSHIMENRAKQYKEKNNRKMTTTLSTRAQQHIFHIAYKMTS